MVGISLSKTLIINLPKLYTTRLHLSKELPEINWSGMADRIGLIDDESVPRKIGLVPEANLSADGEGMKGRRVRGSGRSDWVMGYDDPGSSKDSISIALEANEAAKVASKHNLLVRIGFDISPLDSNESGNI